MTAWTPPCTEGLRARTRRRATPLLPCGLLLALVLGGGVAGCGPRTRAALRVGITAMPTHEFAYLAQTRCFFEREHVNVRLVEFEYLADARRAYERGQLDGCFCTVFEVLQARANSERSPRIVRVVDCSQGFDAVLARPGIAAVESLSGRAVAVEPGSLNLYVLSRALERHRMSLGATRLVGMNPGEMGEALRTGAVDAAVTYPPASSAIVTAGLARPIFTSAEIPGEVLDVLAFDASVLASRRADVDAFVRAYDEAVAWTAGHRDEAYRIMAAPERITPAELGASLDTGIELVSASQQDGYFSPGGTLPRVVDATSRLLVRTGRSRHLVEPADVLSAPAGN